MRVLLIAPDSKLPNLAMMKLSAYHKAMGDVVGFGVSEPDRIYGSIIFSKNRRWAYQWRAMYPEAVLIVGGPGYDPTVRLPLAVESCPPDHTIYSTSKYSVGRVTSGCIRNCYYCVVPKAEPDGIRYIQHPRAIWRPGTVLRLLDDNILAMPKAWMEVYQFCKKYTIKVHFDALDVRLITKKIAAQLRKLHHETGIWFSFDISSNEKAIVKGIENLKSAGNREMHCYVYLNDETAISDAARRWDILRSHGVEPFLMVNPNNLTERLRRVRRRGCRPAIWRGLTTKEVIE